MEKTGKIKMKTMRIIIIAAILVVVAVGIFLLVRNAPQGGGQGTPEINISQVQLKDPQLNALFGSFDASEPSDAVTTIDADVVDSTGLS